MPVDRPTQVLGRPQCGRCSLGQPGGGARLDPYLCDVISACLFLSCPLGPMPACQHLACRSTAPSQARACGLLASAGAWGCGRNRRLRGTPTAGGPTPASLEVALAGFLVAPAELLGGEGVACPERRGVGMETRLWGRSPPEPGSPSVKWADGERQGETASLLLGSPGRAGGRHWGSGRRNGQGRRGGQADLAVPSPGWRG